MRRAISSRHSRKGFTLLELLVATAVGAMVLLVINGTFFGALRLHNSTHERIDEDLSLQRTLGIIRRDLSGLMLPGGTLTGQLQTTPFSSSVQDVAGDRVSPDIYTNSGKVDGWTQFGDVQTVAYYLAPGASTENGKNLIRSVNRNLLAAQTATVDTQTLMTGVASAEVLFYDGTGWTDTWDSEATSTLPTAIKFSLVLATPAGTQTTPEPVELIVPVVVVTTTTAAETATGGTTP